MYCHAPASGQCAICAALCCADCVELVMGVTRQRATCRSCLEAGHRPTGMTGFLKASGLLALALALLFAFVVYLAGG